MLNYLIGVLFEPTDHDRAPARGNQLPIPPSDAAFWNKLHTLGYDHGKRPSCAGEAKIGSSVPENWVVGFQSFSTSGRLLAVDICFRDSEVFTIVNVLANNGTFHADSDSQPLFLTARRTRR